MDGRKICSFQDRITELVNSSSKSRTALAAELHVAKQTLSAWITGQNSPRDPVIVALAEYFGVSVAWLMGYDVPRLSETGMKAGWKEFHSDAHYKDEYEKVKRLEEKIDYSQEERELVAAYRLAEPSAQQYAFEILLNHPAIKKEDSAV